MDLGTDKGTLGGATLWPSDRRAAEAVILVIMMAVSARWVVRRFKVGPTFRSTISMGLMALRLPRNPQYQK